jgi:hypothetical protein
MFEEWFINSVHVKPVPGSFVEKAYSAGYEAGLKHAAARVPLEAIIKRCASDPEWADKNIYPCCGEAHQNWKVTLYLPVPLSESDKSFDAALRRWVASQEGKA